MKQLIVAALLLAPQASPQESNPAAEMEVHDTVAHFLELLGELRFYALDQYMSEGANVTVARWTKSGFVHRTESGEAWLTKLMEGPAPQPFREEIENVAIEIASGELAVVRADFEIVRETGVVSFGVDFFTLVRREGGWEIASIAYTSIPASEREKD